jgi:putative CocE/NonD family hydrolase
MKNIVLLVFLVISSFSIAQNSMTDKIKTDNTIQYVQIPMPDGDSLSAVIVINKKQAEPLPAILLYSIYTNEYDIKKASLAANLGYAGVVVNTRGKNKSASPIEPFKHDTKDAWHMLDWISKQPWCNGKIGMYGGSYLGFVQWAAVKSAHPALKTIVPQAAVAPGIDFPAHNGIFSVYSLQWLKYVSSDKFTSTTGVSKYWSSVGKRWFKSGQAFITLDSLDKRSSPVFQEWLSNPSYNDYWHGAVPYQQEFASVNIPILTITGYYDGDQPGALYYLKEHEKYNPQANHYLIIGPYDHEGAQGVQEDRVYNYTTSAAAKINVNRIVFKWFDYVLKGKEKPEILTDKINYQVMGLDEWQHAPSLASLSANHLIFYLSNKKQGNRYSLETVKPQKQAVMLMQMDFKNRNTETGLRISDSQVIRKKVEDDDALIFTSEPLTEGKIISGCFSGELFATVNKKDMDIVLELYELLPDGTYHDLSHYLGRASYFNNRLQRKLLTPGKVEKIAFSDTFFTSKKIQAGSRIVFIISINKNSEWQINYGTGKDVSLETIADAAEPLKIGWHTNSFIKIPVK